MAQHADFRARLYGVKANQLKGPANSARIRILKILPEWEKSPCRIWWRQLAWGIVPFSISIAPSPLAFGHIGMWGCRCTIHLPILGRWFAGRERLPEILLTYKQLQAHFPGNSSGQSSARTESGPKRERVASESLT